MFLEEGMSWIVGPLGSTKPRSYLSKAFSPTLQSASASRCDNFSSARIYRMVAGAGNPSSFSLKLRSASSIAFISLPTCTPSPLSCRIIAGKYRFARALKKYGSSGALRGRRALTGTIH